jgi:ribosomal protein S27AE
MAKESKKIIELRIRLKELSLRPRKERNKPCIKIKKKHKKVKKKFECKRSEKIIFIQKGVSYKELLKDNHWKVKRDKILKRDKYRCVRCGYSKGLNVHHLKYVGSPWDCPDKYLITLCLNCHSYFHGIELNKQFDRLINSQK